MRLISANSILLSFTLLEHAAESFIPPLRTNYLSQSPTLQISPKKTSASQKPHKFRTAFSLQSPKTVLTMAAEDFTESKYTEAAWAAISGLSNAAEYYQVTSIEAPLLLDVLLNPNKHRAGEAAESSKKVVVKAMSNAGVKLNELRSELETYLSSQGKVNNVENSQKIMGQSLQKVLETARQIKNTLGVSTCNRFISS